METFKINRNIEIVCEWKKTSRAFKHVATLLVNGREVDSTKICYQNRTWERYEFESVMEKLINETTELSKNQKVVANKFIKGRHDTDDSLKIISTIGKLGNIFCDSQKDKNDWKERMIRAGLENQGLIMPEDWETLTDDEKEKRLNGVLDILATN